MSDFKPFYYKEERIGTIPKKVQIELQRFPEIFTISNEKIEVSQEIIGKNVTEEIEKVLLQLKSEGKFPCLKSWKNERYRVGLDFSTKPHFAMERTATPLFGLIQYGVQMNCFTFNENGKLLIWLQRRSFTHPHYPGCYDNLGKNLVYYCDFKVMGLILKLIAYLLIY